MRDPRIEQLAQTLIQYSVKLQQGEKVLIEVFDSALPLAQELVRQAYLAGGQPFVTNKNNELLRAILLECTEEQIKTMAKYEVDRMKDMDAYIGIRAGANINELADVPADKMKIWSKFYQTPVHFDERVKRTKWCILRYPNHSMAQLANMSTAAFADFYFDVCCLDYQKMSKSMDVLAALMNRTDRVHIVGPGTDLAFSIKDIPAVKCAGEMNIPDGEVYTAPVRDSVNGHITFNTPSPYSGFTFEQVHLEFQNGKIINATANDTKRITEVFDTDEGARYVGEFSIAVNPYILHPMKDILFDEKIAGSFHFTPGNCYDDAYNGNQSSIHWDMVCIQRPEYGGGEIYFDDVLIRKDGLFVIDKLKCLNPENLK
ncbi:aminopeptidase [Fodinisporobacter ferrooxydans]|uniref:Aminopeptidase n=1 Tax=Fodinisporobacter ferrooxydans TaxID=2901836 RepID=A0ABY4CKM4_9BACL|nr:aminopeptidase [Alicyclobacillaceae bacterium MYW30-H2]